MPRTSRRKQPLSEETRYRLALAQPKRGLLTHLQKRFGQRTKPVFHQIMEAETRAKRPSEYRGGNLEADGLLKRVLNSQLSEAARDRLMRENHDADAFRQVRTKKAKGRVRALRYATLQRMVRTYTSNPRDIEEMKQLSYHRSRVIRILDGKENPSTIFEAMIPIFEHQLKRLHGRKLLSEQIKYLVEKKTKLPKSMRTRNNVFKRLTQEHRNFTRAIHEVNREMAWLGRMAGRAERGIDVSGAANHYIRKINDHLIEYSITD